VQETIQTERAKKSTGQRIRNRVERNPKTARTHNSTTKTRYQTRTTSICQKERRLKQTIYCNPVIVVVTTNETVCNQLGLTNLKETDKGYLGTELVTLKGRSGILTG
jgi:hypothetical protein